MTARHEVEPQPEGGFAIVDRSDGRVTARAPLYRDAMDMARHLNEARGAVVRKAAPPPRYCCDGLARVEAALRHFLTGLDELAPALGMADAADELRRLGAETLGILSSHQSNPQEK